MAVLDPHSALEDHLEYPDENMTHSVGKQIIASSTVNTDGDILVLTEPFSGKAHLGPCLFVRHTATDDWVFGQRLTPEQDISVNYDSYRTVSGQTTGNSATFALGASNLEGQAFAASVNRLPEIGTIEEMPLLSYASSSNMRAGPVSIMDGVQALCVPSTDNPYRRPRTGGIRDGSRDTVFNGSTTSNAAGWCTAGVVVPDAGEVFNLNTAGGRPVNARGRVRYDFVLPWDTNAADNAIRYTVEFTHKKWTSSTDWSETTTTETHVFDSAQTSASLTVSISLKGEFDSGDNIITNLRIVATDAGVSGVRVTGLQSMAEVRFPDMQEGDFEHCTALIFTGMTAGQNVLLNSVLNLQAVPDAALSRDLRASAPVAGLTDELQLVHHMLDGHQAFPMASSISEYTYALRSGKADSLSTYDSLRSNTSWKSFKRVLKRKVIGAGKQALSRAISAASPGQDPRAAAAMGALEGAINTSTRPSNTGTEAAPPLSDDEALEALVDSESLQGLTDAVVACLQVPPTNPTSSTSTQDFEQASLEHEVSDGMEQFLRNMGLDIHMPPLPDLPRPQRREQHPLQSNTSDMEGRDTLDAFLDSAETGPINEPPPPVDEGTPSSGFSNVFDITYVLKADPASGAKAMKWLKSPDPSQRSMEPSNTESTADASGTPNTAKYAVARGVGVQGKSVHTLLIVCETASQDGPPLQFVTKLRTGERSKVPGPSRFKSIGEQYPSLRVPERLGYENAESIQACLASTEATQESVKGKTLHIFRVGHAEDGSPDPEQITRLGHNIPEEMAATNGGSLGAAGCMAVLGLSPRFHLSGGMSGDTIPELSDVSLKLAFGGLQPYGIVLLASPTIMQKGNTAKGRAIFSLSPGDAFLREASKKKLAGSIGDVVAYTLLIQARATDIHTAKVTRAHREDKLTSLGPLRSLENQPALTDLLESFLEEEETFSPDEFSNLYGDPVAAAIKEAAHPPGDHGQTMSQLRGIVNRMVQAKREGVPDDTRQRFLNPVIKAWHEQEFLPDADAKKNRARARKAKVASKKMEVTKRVRAKVPAKQAVSLDELDL